MLGSPHVLPPSVCALGGSKLVDTSGVASGTNNMLGRGGLVPAVLASRRSLLLGGHLWCGWYGVPNRRPFGEEEANRDRHGIFVTEGRTDLLLSSFS